MGQRGESFSHAVKLSCFASVEGWLHAGEVVLVVEVEVWLQTGRTEVRLM